MISLDLEGHPVQNPVNHGITYQPQLVKHLKPFCINGSENTMNRGQTVVMSHRTEGHVRSPMAAAKWS